MENCQIKYSRYKKIATIYYYIKQYVTDLQLEYKMELPSENKIFYFDMYSPNLNLAIEYDRYIRFNNNKNHKLDNLLEKERIITNYVNLIKIRENQLLGLNSDNYLHKFKEIHISKENKQSLNSVIYLISKELINNYNINSHQININIDSDLHIIEKEYNKIKHMKTLKYKYPEIYSEIYKCLDEDIDIEYLKPMSNTKVEWKCKQCGNIWTSTVAYRVLKSNNLCPYCNNKKVLPGYNDLATTHPYLASQWHNERNNLTPHDVVAGSDKYIWWKCDKGHEWQAIIKNRTSKNTGCPYCSNKKVLPGYNDLATTHPNLIQEWSNENINLKPTNITASSRKSVIWSCQHGHTWTATVYSRAKLGSDCPLCRGTR